jgi:hypothetical protein
METIGAFEAKTHLASLLDRTAQGETFMALIGFRGGGMPHPTKPPTRAPSRALPRRRALCTN